MAVKEFLKSKIFLKNLLFIIVFFLLLIVIVNFSLKLYTRHGKEYIVPQITGLKYQDIENDKALNHFRIMVMDSIFKEGIEAGTILSQDPIAGNRVKGGRKIYITIATSKGEIVHMPNCIDRGIKAAVQQLVDAGLRVGTIMYRVGEVDGVVVEQRYRGKRINAQSDVQSGDNIDLVVEVTSTTKTVRMPDILSKVEGDAEVMLWKAGLNVGKKVYQGKQDNSHTRVASFTPHQNSVMIGTAVNITLINDSEAAYRKKMEDFKQEQQEIEVEDEDDTILIGQ